MSWAKLDDGLTFHPKVIAAGNEGTGIFCRCLTYSASHLLDGRVPAEIALIIAGNEKALDRVVATGLLQELPHTGDYVLSNYADYNPLRDEVEAKRLLRSEAGKRGGIASGKARSK